MKILACGHGVNYYSSSLIACAERHFASQNVAFGVSRAQHYQDAIVQMEQFRPDIVIVMPTTVNRDGSDPWDPTNRNMDQLSRRTIFNALSRAIPTMFVYDNTLSESFVRALKKIYPEGFEALEMLDMEPDACVKIFTDLEVCLGKVKPLKMSLAEQNNLVALPEPF